MSVTLLPGKKWLPCSERVPPTETLVLPLNDKLGANNVRPSPMMLAMMMIGIIMAVISNAGAQPFGAGLGC